MWESYDEQLNKLHIFDSISVQKVLKTPIPLKEGGVVPFSHTADNNRTDCL